MVRGVRLSFSSSLLCAFPSDHIPLLLYRLRSPSPLDRLRRDPRMVLCLSIFIRELCRDSSISPRSNRFWILWPWIHVFSRLGYSSLTRTANLPSLQVSRGMYALGDKTGWCFPSYFDVGFIGEPRLRPWINYPLEKTARSILFIFLAACGGFAEQLERKIAFLVVDNYYMPPPACVVPRASQRLRARNGQSQQDRCPGGIQVLGEGGNPSREQRGHRVCPDYGALEEVCRRSVQGLEICPFRI